MPKIIDLYGLLELLRKYKMFKLELTNYSPDGLSQKKKKYGAIWAYTSDTRVLIGVMSKGFWQFEKKQIRELFNKEIKNNELTSMKR